MLLAGRDLILHTGSLGIGNMQGMWAELIKNATALLEKNPPTAS
jgi:hypothetical protein